MISTRIIAITSIMTALGIAGRILLVIIPNVSPVAPITMLSGSLMGPTGGFLVGFLTMFISDFYIGAGPWTLITSTSMGLIGLLSGFIFNRTRDKILIFLSAFSLTLIYDILTSILTLSILGIKPIIAILNLFIPIFLGFIPYPMGPIHEFSSAFILLYLHNSLQPHFRVMIRNE